MPKVINPLGSVSARGQVGKSIIFQGQTAKRYASPRMTASAAREEQQANFQSINKMVDALRYWGRGALQTMYGTGWFATAFQEISLRWADAESIYAGLTTEERGLWVNNAPYKFTMADKGKTFFACAYGMYDSMGVLGQGYFDLVEPVATNAATIADWWVQDLGVAFAPGKFDDTNPSLSYTPPLEWSSANGSVMYGGSTKISAANGTPTITFWFFGTSLSLIFSKGPTLGALNVQIDGLAPVVVSQNNATWIHQQEWNCGVINYGLHRCEIVRDGAAGSYYFDGLEVFGA